MRTRNYFAHQTMPEYEVIFTNAKIRRSEIKLKIIMKLCAHLHECQLGVAYPFLLNNPSTRYQVPKIPQVTLYCR